MTETRSTPPVCCPPTAESTGVTAPLVAAPAAAASGLATPAAAPGADHLDADARELHRVLEDLLRAVQFRDRDRICCHDVSVSQCYALEAVVGRGPLTLNELAAALYLDKSTASRVADALVRKGYLDRRPHPGDGRAVQLAATAAGDELYRRIERDLVAEVRTLAADFPPEVRRSMTRLLGRLARAAAERVECGDGVCRMR